MRSPNFIFMKCKRKLYICGRCRWRTCFFFVNLLSAKRSTLFRSENEATQIHCDAVKRRPFCFFSFRTFFCASHRTEKPFCRRFLSGWNLSQRFPFRLLVIQLTDAICCSSCSVSYPGKFTWASEWCACTATNLTILCSTKFRGRRILIATWSASIVGLYGFSASAAATSSCSLATETNFVGLDDVVQTHFDFINHFGFSFFLFFTTLCFEWRRM